jgi:hypothetical protein
MTKISGIGTTETDWANIAYLEAERGDGTSVKIAPSLFPLAHSGALVHKSADQNTANYSAGVMVAWDSEASGYDTDGYHDATDTSRLTILADGKYELAFGIQATNVSASDFVRAFTAKNGSANPFIGGALDIKEVSNVVSIYLCASSAPVACVAGDYFEVWLDTESDTSISVIAAGSWFSIKRIA